MITFKQFLSEARMAPLYHGTKIDFFSDIMRDKFIDPKTQHLEWKLLKRKIDPKNDDSAWSQRKGISLTRSLPFAMHWGQVVIVLDQQKLTHRYKLVPIQFWQDRPDHKEQVAPQPSRSPDTYGRTNEYEEFVMTDKPVSINYATGIIVRNSRYAELIYDKLKKYKVDLPIYEYDDITHRTVRWEPK